jgi:two-component system chemotaxis response regulator CheB
MNGLEALPEIRKLRPHVPIIMFSTLTERGAAATLDALSLGATDYVTKPSNFNAGATSESIVQQLIPKIKALCLVADGPNAPHSRSAASLTGSVVPVTAPPLAFRRSASGPGGRIEIIAVGVSTGGPEALAKFLPMFPPDFPVPIVIAQHMPPIFTALLAQRLTGKCRLPVRECKSGELLEAGTIWIAAGDYHMVLQREIGAVRLRLNQEPRENFCRPSVDVLFRSVASTFGTRALAVILTGMGQDGVKGCQALATQGARILVQDEASSVVWGMPGFVARAGLAEKILPLDQMAPEIIRCVSASNQLAPVRVH